MSEPPADRRSTRPGCAREDELLDEALAVAARAHLGQRRPDGAPYLSHPLRVCDLLAEAGGTRTQLAAALLHDAVEDSELTVGEVVERFGVEVGELVAALTEEEAIADWAERKRALRAQVAEAGPQAAAIYAADKLANLRDLRDLYGRLGEDAIDLHKAPTLDARVAAWRQDAEMVDEVAPGLGLNSVLRSELESFAQRRAQEAVSGQEAAARG